ncbi:MAG: pyruvate kinase [Mycoplasma sp.]|nr:pyruvate kinase [Mycoplasma sp.]
MHIKKKTKLITTIGPISKSKEMIEKLFLAGMTTVRLNFSHGDTSQHISVVKNTREISDKYNFPISIMLDTKGPEIRIGKIKDEGQLIEKNQIITIYTSNDDYQNKICLDNQLTMSYDLSKDVKIGNKILVDDGKLQLEVLEVEKHKIITKALNAHFTKSNKRVNVPGIKLSLEFLSKQDEKDINFAIDHNLDFIAASFVNSKEDIKQIRDILNKKNNRHIQIISKIESQYAIDHLDEIIHASDGVMVARGDLGLEIPYYEVPIIQKRIIRKCRELGKMVIVATQMLDSMEKSPQPTRAEVTDVYLAVELGSDAVMLSGESAIGLYPIEAVKVMAQIAIRAEQEFYKKIYYQLHLENIKNKNLDDREKIALEIAKKTMKNDYKFTIVFSKTGQILKAISKFRPNTNIIGISSDETLYSSFGLTSSVFMWKNGLTYNQITNNMSENLKKILANYNIKENDKFLIVRNHQISEGIY